MKKQTIYGNSPTIKSAVLGVMKNLARAGFAPPCAKGAPENSPQFQLREYGSKESVPTGRQKFISTNIVRRIRRCAFLATPKIPPET